jgi:hypothetical protein
VKGVLKTFGDIEVKGAAYSVRGLVRELLNAGGPVELPAAKYEVPSKDFACKFRESNLARATFHVDLVADTVDFASGAHRAPAAEAEAARWQWAWKWCW